MSTGSLSNSFRNYKATLPKDVLSYPSPELMDEWRYSNYIKIDAFNYGTNIRELEKIIILPLPEELSTSLQPSWSQESTAIGAAYNAALSFADQRMGTLSGVTQLVAGMAGSSFGIIMNPMQQMLFKFVNFRTINFNWNLSPKCPEDSSSLVEIIKTLKFYSLPSLGALGGFVMNYPAEFDIKFLFNKGVNPEQGEAIAINESLFALDRCVITDITANYSPTGTYSNFYTGAPIEVNLQITFQEIYQLNRQKFIDIFNLNKVSP